jgi:hypothetical protein
MKKNSSSRQRSASLIFTFIFLSSLSPFLNAQATWQYQGDYSAIYSVYDAHHYCIKDGAFAKITSDGGATYTNLGLPASGLLAVQYLSPSELMALSSAGGQLELHHSNDGGLTFNSKGTVLDASILGLNNREFYFLNATTGFIYNQVMFDGNLMNLLLKTENGGQSWSILGDTTGFDQSNYMYFDKDGNIFGAGSMQGYGLYVSQDTGKTFQLLNGNIPNITSGVEFAYDGVQTFMVTGVVGSNNDCCYISTDGGNSFNSWTVGTGGGQSIAFTKPGNVLIFGTSDTTALSNDNGNSFSTLRFGADKPAGSVYFIHSFDNDQGFYLYDGNAKLWIYGLNNIGLSEQMLAQTFSFCPNPVEDFIQIERPYSSPGQLQLYIYNSSGQLIHTHQINTLHPVNLSHLQAGTYFLSLQSGSEYYPAQVLIKK